MDLLVVGAGVIGLSCAWRAASAGIGVTVLGSRPRPAGRRGWRVGCSPPSPRRGPGRRSCWTSAWSRCAAGRASRVTSAGHAGLRTEGTVVAATGTGDRAELDTLAGFLSRLGRDVERLSGRELRRLEPALGPDVRGGLSVPGDLAVDNRVLLAALRSACGRAGVLFVAQAVKAVLDDGERVTGVRTDGPDIETDAVLVCAGAHSAELHPALDGLVRPVKGEILRLAHRPGAFPPPQRTVRALVDGRPVYAVPRDGGGLVVGATQYETGFDTDVTVGGVRDLLRDAERVLPGIAEYALVESSAGLRPGSPDNLPLIGALGPGRVVHGHRARPQRHAARARHRRRRARAAARRPRAGGGAGG